MPSWRADGIANKKTKRKQKIKVCKVVLLIESEKYISILVSLNLNEIVLPICGVFVLNFNLSAIRLILFFLEADTSDCIDGSGSIQSSQKRIRIHLGFLKADPDPSKIYDRPKINLIVIEWNSRISASNQI